MLRYAADIRSLIFVAIYFSLTALGWITHERLPWYLNVAMIVLASFFSFFCAVIVHNTIHCPVFKSGVLNRFFQVILSLTYGHMVSAYVPGHNFSHHKEVQTRKDVIRTTKARFRINLFNQLFFFFLMSDAILKSEIRFVRKMYKVKPRWFRQYLLEAIIVFGVKIFLIIIDWEKALLYLIIPNQYAAWGIVGTNFWQHDGCDENHKYNHSRNFTGKILNFFAFNNGYHGLHHMRQGLHWSLLPEIHKRVLSPYIHPALEQKSLLRYLIRVCVYPMVRETYDGKPIPVPEKSEDIDWVENVQIDTSKIPLGAVS